MRFEGFPAPFRTSFGRSFLGPMNYEFMHWKGPKNSWVRASEWKGEPRWGLWLYHLSGLKGNFWYRRPLPESLPRRGTFRIFRWFDFRLCPAAMPKSFLHPRAGGGGFDGASLFASELLFDMRLSLERVFRIFVKAREKHRPKKKNKSI